MSEHVKVLEPMADTMDKFRAQVPVAATLNDAAADPALTLDVARELLRDAAAGIRSLAASATSEPDADLELIWHSVSDNAETNAAYRRLKARLAALKTQRPGWVMVPVEPTDEMLDAGWSAGDFHIMHYDGIDKPGTPRYSLRRSYAAMLAAAQESANG